MQVVRAVGTFREQAGQVFIGAGRFFGGAPMGTRSRRHGPRLNGTGASAVRSGARDGCDDALRRFFGAGSTDGTDGAGSEKS